MTQKELLYVEDAICHEDNIINICNDIISRLDDEDVINFIKEELEGHNNTKNKLMDLLEDNVNG